MSNFDYRGCNNFNYTDCQILLHELYNFCYRQMPACDVQYKFNPVRYCRSQRKSYHLSPRRSPRVLSRQVNEL